MKSLAWIAAALCVASPLAAQQGTTEQTTDRVHVVRSGDTLWDIARSYLNDPFLWPEIFRLNTDVVRNPARIHPSERLRLPGGGGVFVVSADEPGRTIFFPRDEAATATVGHTVRAAGSADVPIIAPGDFYRAGFLARDRDVQPAGELVERIFPSVIALDLPPTVQLYDRILVALRNGTTAQPGEQMIFYRPGRPVRQFGRVFHPTGIATVVAVDGNVATAVVVRGYDAMTVGDIAMPLPRFPVPPGVLPVEDRGPEARIVAFQSPNTLQMKEDIAFVNVGQASGVVEGDEFSVYLPVQRARWGTRPEVEVARLQIVRVGERTSAARVMAMSYPALEAGLAVRRVARMP